MKQSDREFALTFAMWSALDTVLAQVSLRGPQPGGGPVPPAPMIRKTMRDALTQFHPSAGVLIAARTATGRTMIPAVTRAWGALSAEDKKSAPEVVKDLVRGMKQAESSRLKALALDEQRLANLRANMADDEIQKSIDAAEAAKMQALEDLAKAEATLRQASALDTQISEELT